ncbi:MGH1-like glycoside hydrolase domain-containing protein [Hamadaea tsunoensis]|uniref:MGH1-like glycoside hydrolase domain-containing protein n=1 Tax=Hamadaea tsunoensis TaxID=53368 RepID=UPI00040383DF|nr:glucosidase [Hamadaea tsunoensis]
MGAERERLREADAGAAAWRGWGPYLSERAWGTVREDYSEHGEAWDYFPHDHARSRTYRWSEDGLAGVSDEHQVFCFAFAFWNGADNILKERIFGLGGPEGNHGEDAKDYWWYLDSTPTHSYMRWRYHYPQARFPYEQIAQENRERTREDTEFELIDTGVFDEGKFWAIEVTYAKAGPTDYCVEIVAANRGEDEATLHILPTMWFRNTWSWGQPGRDAQPVLRGTAEGGRLEGRHQTLGQIVLEAAPGPDGVPPPALVCDNETNARRLWNLAGRSAYPKDGIGEHLINGHDSVNPELTGTKAALHYAVTVPGRGEVRLKLRLALTAPPPVEAPAPRLDLGGEHDRTMAARRAEADEFFAELIPPGTPPAEAEVVRQGVAGLMWSKQFYHFDVQQWLSGDPASAPLKPERRKGRNSAWRHMNCFDVISMPDPWEYPWYAAWDLAFQAIAIAHVDPGFAKSQILLLMREWYQHPNGQIPAYEWAFGDVNPPVQAWAALRVFQLDGGRDFEFLKRVMHKLMINFTWWVNRKDVDGNNVFEGGFLGLDNIGPFDRNDALPTAGKLEQSDGTGWMATYALNMLEMATILALHDRAFEDIATKFFEHFAYIAAAAAKLWDDEDGFFYDALHLPDGSRLPLRARSAVGLIPLCATTTIGTVILGRLPELTNRIRWFLQNRPQYADVVGARRIAQGGQQMRLLSVVDPDRLLRILRRLLDTDEFLSPYGVRSLSKAHADKPLQIELGGQKFTLDYEPAESTSGTFGGNSNWRGPVWMPVNFLMIGALREFAEFFGDDLRVEYPSRSGTKLSLNAVADDLCDRLIALFVPDAHGRRPIYGIAELFQTDPDWKDLIIFPEYFHGDNGAALGAWHQTGWTGLIVDIIISRHKR